MTPSIHIKPTRQNPLHTPKTAGELFKLTFPPLRSAIVEAAAALDRVRRADGGESLLRNHPEAIRAAAAIDVLRDQQGDKAARVLLAFSDAAETVQ